MSCEHDVVAIWIYRGQLDGETTRIARETCLACNKVARREATRRDSMARRAAVALAKVEHRQGGVLVGADTTDALTGRLVGDESLTDEALEAKGDRVMEMFRKVQAEHLASNPLSPLSPKRSNGVDTKKTKPRRRAKRARGGACG